MAQPRRWSIRPVENATRTPAAHAPNAALPTTNAITQILAGAQAGRIEDGEGEDDDARIADDRVADDVFQVVLHERREGSEDDRGDGDHEDQVADDVEIDQQRRDRAIDPGKRDDSERRRRKCGEDGQRGVGHGVRETGDPQVERDRPEPDGDRDGER